VFGVRGHCTFIPFVSGITRNTLFPRHRLHDKTRASILFFYILSSPNKLPRRLFREPTRRCQKNHADLRHPCCVETTDGSSAEKHAYFASRGVCVKMLLSELLAVPAASVVGTPPAAGRRGWDFLASRCCCLIEHNIAWHVWSRNYGEPRL